MDGATPKPMKRALKHDGKVVHHLAFEADDRALVRALRGDHPGAYEVLYRKYAEDVLAVLYRVLGSDTEMDELLHEVFVRAFRNVDAIENPDAAGDMLESASRVLRYME